MDERQYDERHEVTGVTVSGVSAVSWAAVLAGAVVAAAVSLLLFALVSGLDLAAMSPNSSAQLASFAESTAIALIVTQWISACAGGYITGRLRIRWAGTHTHEVFFRDTAHGFLTWSVATLFMASGLVSVGSAIAGHSTRTNIAARAPAVTEGSGRPQATHGELLLRLTPAGAPRAGAAGVSSGAGVSPDRAAAAARVAGRQLLLPERPTESAAEPASTHESEAVYLARLVPASDIPDARQAVAWQGSDSERKDVAAISIFTALSMLVGAFIASVSAAIGGRLRDRHP